MKALVIVLGAAVASCAALLGLLGSCERAETPRAGSSGRIVGVHASPVDRNVDRPPSDDTSGSATAATAIIQSEIAARAAAPGQGLPVQPESTIRFDSRFQSFAVHDQAATAIRGLAHDEAVLQITGDSAQCQREEAEQIHRSCEKCGVSPVLSGESTDEGSALDAVQEHYYRSCMISKGWSL